jgi:hypothetical protein
MSRHHMLPPLAYVPPPRPKKIENRKRRIQTDDVNDLEMTAEALEATAASRSAPAGSVLPQPNFPAIEGSARKPHNPGGRLSEDTLKMMLQVQGLK